MTTLFISDLHLDPAQPHVIRLFESFIEEWAARAEALYILGDLFEIWLGDDDPRPETQYFKDLLKRAAKLSGGVFFQHGNRDFLFGEQAAEECGCMLLPDSPIIDLYGTPTLLMHGDQLCTDDVKYQEFRALTRSHEWQHEFLAQPFEKRIELARGYRDQSREQTRKKPELILDVNQDAIERAMRKAGVFTLIHGHTHRSNTHRFSLDDREATRVVLGDWDRHAYVYLREEQQSTLFPYPQSEDNNEFS